MSDTDLAFRATLDGSGFANGMQGLEGSLNRFGIQTNSATANLGGLGTVLGTMANPATAAALAITSVGAGLAASVNVAGNFQQKMAGVSAIMYDSSKSAAENAQMQQALSDAAREAGATTQFSASQAADALGFMAGAGWNAQQATTGLKDTLMLSAAGGMDLAAAGDLMTGTVAQFGLEATDAARVSNTLAAGASATNTSVSALGQGMTVVGATANAFGMSLESTTAALGSLSNANIKGAEGGTALRGILASLATQSGTASAALAELGVTNEQINPEMVSLGDAMQLLQDRGMTASQAIAIFGRENVSAATYMAAHASELDGLEQSITGTSKAAEMAATMTDTYQGAMGELSSAVEEAEIALGSVLLPVVTQTIDLMAAGVTAATDFGKSIYDAIQPEGSVGSIFASSDAWLAENFGFPTGEAAAEGIAEGIEGNTDTVAASIEEATGGADALAAVASSGADTGEAWVKSFGDAAEKGMTLVNGQWTSQAAAVADQIETQNISLEGQEYVLQRIVTTQGMYYSLLDASTQEIVKQSGYIKSTNDAITWTDWANSLDLPQINMDNLWDVGDSQRSWLKFKSENSGLAKTAGDEIILALYNAEQAAIAENDPTLTESLNNVMSALASPGSVPAEIFNQSLADIIDAGYIGSEWADDLTAAGTKAAESAGKSFAEALGMAMKDEMESFDWSTALSSSFSDTSGISDLGSFAEAVFQPELIATASENLDLWNTGLESNRDQVQENINIMEQLASVNSWLYTDDQLTALEKYLDKKIDEKELLESLSNAQTDLNSAVQETVATVESFVGATVNYPTYREQADEDWAASALINAADSRIATVGSMTGYTAYARQKLSEAGIEAEDPVMSKIDEYVEGMKKVSEESSTQSQTLVNVATSASECTIALEGLGTQLDTLTGSGTGLKEKKVDVLGEGIFQTGSNLAGGSSSQSENAITYLQQINTNTDRTRSGITTLEKELQSTINTTSANQIKQMVTLQSGVITAISTAASSINSAISAAASSIIDAIQSEGGGGGGGWSGGGSGGSGGGYSPTYSNFGSGGGPYWNTTPFFSEGGYADRAMLAVVGDSPGGEYMVPAQKLESFLATMAAQSHATIGLDVDSSALSTQIQSAIGHVSVPVIRLPVQVVIDSSEIYDAVERAIKTVLDETSIRLR